MGMNMNPGAGSHPFPPSIVLRDVEPETDRVDDNLRRGLQRGLLLLVLLALVVLTTLWLTSVRRCGSPPLERNHDLRIDRKDQQGHLCQKTECFALEQPRFVFALVDRNG